MSCETNFHEYFQLVAGAGSEVAAAFGGDPQQAQAALDQIFQTARNQAFSAASPQGSVSRPPGENHAAARDGRHDTVV